MVLFFKLEGNWILVGAEDAEVEAAVVVTAEVVLGSVLTIGAEAGTLVALPNNELVVEVMAGAAVAVVLVAGVAEAELSLAVDAPKLKVVVVGAAAAVVEVLKVEGIAGADVLKSDVVGVVAGAAEVDGEAVAEAEPKENGEVVVAAAVAGAEVEGVKLKPDEVPVLV